MINIDLKYIQEWSKRWLVKFNPSKTDIMVFNKGPNTDPWGTPALSSPTLEIASLIITL
jgi:hypothetical protein